jgi:hypothetical protein
VKSYNVSAPSRFGPPQGLDAGQGAGRRWSRVGGAWFQPGVSRLGARAGLGGPADLGSMFSGAWNNLLTQGLNAGEVALGAVLILAALGIVLSQTSAGRTAGAAGGGAARRGLRFIPGVGALA